MFPREAGASRRAQDARGALRRGKRAFSVASFRSVPYCAALFSRSGDAPDVHRTAHSSSAPAGSSPRPRACLGALDARRHGAHREERPRAAVHERRYAVAGVTRQVATSPFSRATWFPAGRRRRAQLSTAFRGPEDCAHVQPVEGLDRPVRRRLVRAERAHAENWSGAVAFEGRRPEAAAPPEARRAAPSRDGPNSNEGRDALPRRSKAGGKARSADRRRPARAQTRPGARRAASFLNAPPSLHCRDRVVHDRRVVRLLSRAPARGGRPARLARAGSPQHPRWAPEVSARLTHVELGMRSPLFVFAQPVAHAFQRAALPFPLIGRESLQEHAGGRGVRRGSVLLLRSLLPRLGKTLVALVPRVVEHLASVEFK